MHEKPSRRTRTSKPGVFYRDTPHGRRYEVWFRDHEGRRRWKTVDGNLADAVAAREELHGKIRRGERVAPSKAMFRDVGIAWLDAQTALRPRTREWYDVALRVHLFPYFGRKRIADVSEDDIAAFIAWEQRRGKAGWTIRGTLVPLNRILSHAARRGMIASNPMGRLERGERPTVGRREMRILTREEIEKVLAVATAPYRTMIALSVFSGLRLGELRGLTWSDVDTKSGVLHVRKQADRHGSRVEPKTPQAIRDVVVMPALGRLLLEHKAAVRHTRPGDFVFASSTGRALNGRNISKRGLDKAMERAQLDGEEHAHMRWHDLRHTAASLLVAQGFNVVYVSRQLGHASPDITLRVYAKLYDGAEHAERARAALEAGYGTLLEQSGAERAVNEPVVRAAQEGSKAGKVVQMASFRE